MHSTLSLSSAMTRHEATRLAEANAPQPTGDRAAPWPVALRGPTCERRTGPGRGVCERCELGCRWNLVRTIATGRLATPPIRSQWGYEMVRPPSTTITWPVMKDDSSDAR